MMTAAWTGEEVAASQPAKAQELAAAVEAMYGEFAKDGPTPGELTVAKKQLVAFTRFFHCLQEMS